MRWFVLIECLLLAGCDCERGEKEAEALVIEQVAVRSGIEVRSYDVEVELLESVAMMNRYREGADSDPFEADEEMIEDDYYLTGVNWLGPVVKEAGFESRFLNGIEELRECAKRVREIVGHEKAQVEAVYDVRGGRLIVKGELGIHRSLKTLIEARMPFQMWTSLAVYELPGVSFEDRSGFWGEAPKEAKLLQEVSWLAVAGQGSVVRGANGSVYVEAEQQWDANDDYTDSRLTCEWDLPGGGFSWKTGFMGVLGVKWAQEVGSLDGEKTLMLVRRQDRVLSDGRRWDEWILKEEGGAFLNEEMLEVMRWRDPELAVKMDFSRPFQVFEVPPTFDAFLAHGDEGIDLVKKDDFPELKGVKGELVSVRRLMRENGIAFGDGDFVVFQRGNSRLFAKLSEINLELLDGIVHATLGLGPPEECYVEFAEVEGEDIRKGKVLRKIGVVALPGQEAEVTLGDDLAFQVEMQLDGGGLVEMRADLTEESDLENPNLRTAVVMEVGQPLVVSQTLVGGKRRSWVATVRVKVFEKELGEFLKKREAGR